MAMLIRDRIRELRRVPARQLRPNGRAWRQHPPLQRETLQGLLAELGYCDALLARELPDGSLMLIDGHLRRELTPDRKVPVLVLDVSEQEADTLLLTLDPLASLAEANPQALQALLNSMPTSSTAVTEMLHQMAGADRINFPADATTVHDPVPPTARNPLPAATVPDPVPPEEFDVYDEAIETEYRCPKCAYAWSGKPK
jgi:hypothetical protein